MSFDHHQSVANHPDKVKRKELPHGHFLPWLEAEFGWTQQHARRMMALASKTNILFDLPVDLSAAYKLAAPSTPAEELRRPASGGIASL